MYNFLSFLNCCCCLFLLNLVNGRAFTRTLVAFCCCDSPVAVFRTNGVPLRYTNRENKWTQTIVCNTRIIAFPWSSVFIRIPLQTSLVLMKGWLALYLRSLSLLLSFYLFRSLAPLQAAHFSSKRGFWLHFLSIRRLSNIRFSYFSYFRFCFEGEAGTVCGGAGTKRKRDSLISFLCPNKWLIHIQFKRCQVFSPPRYRARLCLLHSIGSSQ